MILLEYLVPAGAGGEHAGLVSLAFLNKTTDQLAEKSILTEAFKVLLVVDDW